MSIITNNAKLTKPEVEIQFLRMVIARAVSNDGYYLTDNDMKAISVISKAHCQDIHHVNTTDLALANWENLNPGYKYAKEV